MNRLCGRTSGMGASTTTGSTSVSMSYWLVAFGYETPWTSKEHMTPPGPDMFLVAMLAQISCYVVLVQTKLIDYFVLPALVWFIS